MSFSRLFLVLILFIISLLLVILCSTKNALLCLPGVMFTAFRVIRLFFRSARFIRPFVGAFRMFCLVWAPPSSPVQKAGKSGKPGTPVSFSFSETTIAQSPDLQEYNPWCRVLNEGMVEAAASEFIISLVPIQRLANASLADSSSTCDILGLEDGTNVLSEAS